MEKWQSEPQQILVQVHTPAELAEHKKRGDIVNFIFKETNNNEK